MIHARHMVLPDFMSGEVYIIPSARSRQTMTRACVAKAVRVKLNILAYGTNDWLFIDRMRCRQLSSSRVEGNRRTFLLLRCRKISATLANKNSRFNSRALHAARNYPRCYQTSARRSLARLRRVANCLRCIHADCCLDVQCGMRGDEHYCGTRKHWAARAPSQQANA